MEQLRKLPSGVLVMLVRRFRRLTGMNFESKMKKEEINLHKMLAVNPEFEAKCPPLFTESVYKEQVDAILQKPKEHIEKIQRIKATR